MPSWALQEPRVTGWSISLSVLKRQHHFHQSSLYLALTLLSLCLHECGDLGKVTLTQKSGIFCTKTEQIHQLCFLEYDTVDPDQLGGAARLPGRLEQGIVCNYSVGYPLSSHPCGCEVSS